MRQFRHISLMLAALVVCHTVGDDLWAKNGHSGTKGGSGKSSNASSSLHGNGGSKKSGGGATYPGKPDPSLVGKRGETKHWKDCDPPNDSGDFFNSTDKKLRELDGKLTGPEKAAAQQLRNEVRMLKMRMDLAKRMRALAERTGNDKLLEAADRLQQHALDHFHKRMEQLSEFRRRHGLPDLSHHLAD